MALQAGNQGGSSDSSFLEGKREKSNVGSEKTKV